ncbi:MAG: hypothetical protein ACP6IY_21245 [Promethearchaeia archaeon]
MDVNRKLYIISGIVIILLGISLIATPIILYYTNENYKIDQFNSVLAFGGFIIAITGMYILEVLIKEKKNVWIFGILVFCLGMGLAIANFIIQIFEITLIGAILMVIGGMTCVFAKYFYNFLRKKINFTDDLITLKAVLKTILFLLIIILLTIGLFIYAYLKDIITS